jgi:6-phosphogluconolactonase
MNVETFLDFSMVANKAASIIAEEARLAITQRDQFIMAVSGGNTPWFMLRALSNEDLPWEKIHIFQVDERIAPAGSPDRNLTHLQESLLSQATIPLDNIHAMPVEDSNLAAAAKKYELSLKKIAGPEPVFDLIHLGLGADGHTASLIPGDPVLEIHDTDVAITALYQGHLRMTLTYPVINRARHILWVVTGNEKIQALNQLLSADHSIPAGLINQDHATILSDCEFIKTFETHKKKAPFLKVGLAADHGGFELKENLLDRLRSRGYEPIDFGSSSLSIGDDYPDYVTPLAQAVAGGKIDRGIALCGSGVGASICANKVHGVRAALIHDHFSAKQGTEDDHMNIMCLGGRTIGAEVAWDLVTTFLHSQPSHDKRHLRRLEKVFLLDSQNCTH